MARTLKMLWIVAAAVGLFGRAGAAQEERWYVLEMMGSKAGWMRSVETERADGNIVSETEMKMTIARGEVRISIRVATEFVETAEGRPVSMRAVQEFGPSPTIVEHEFREDHVVVRTTQAGRTTETRAEWPAPGWLTPAAAGREARRKIEGGQTEVRQSLLDPSTGLTPIETKRVRRAEGTVQAMGKTVSAAEWVVTQSVYPGIESIEWLDREGELVRGSLDLGGIVMEVLASEKEIALADAQPPEIMASTLIRPSRKIDDPRTLEEAVYIVRITKGDLPDLPSAGGQTFERRDAVSARVTVRADAGEPVGADFDRGPYLASSSMIGTDDPEIAKFVGAAAPGSDPREMAEQLRRRVHRHINQKTLDVGLASASDVVRTREGDCTEHAVLLAAALRAAGIPSRVVSGAVYIDEFLGAEGVFGYHMWTQALLPTAGGGAEWVDLDATLGEGRAFDAAHIAMNVSALADGEMINSLATLAPLMGRLAVEVVETSAPVGAAP